MADMGPVAARRRARHWRLTIIRTCEGRLDAPSSVHKHANSGFLGEADEAEISAGVSGVIATSAKHPHRRDFRASRPARCICGAAMDTWYNLFKNGLFGTDGLSTHVIEMLDRNNHMVVPREWHRSRQNAPRHKEIRHGREVALQSSQVVVCGFADQILLLGVNNRRGPAFTTDFEVNAKVTKAVQLTQGVQNLFNHRSPTVLLVANATSRPTILRGGNVYDAILVTFRRTSMRHFITAGLLASLSAAASAQVVKYPTTPPGRTQQRWRARHFRSPRWPLRSSSSRSRSSSRTTVGRRQLVRDERLTCSLQHIV